MSNDQEPKAVRILTFKGSARDLESFWSKLQSPDQLTVNNDPIKAATLAEPSNILPFPKKVVSPAPEEEYRASRPSRRIPVEGVRPPVEAQHRARGRQGFQLSQWVLRGTAAILTVGSIYLAREPLSEAADSFINFVVDGLYNQPGLEDSRKSYFEHNSYINLQEQLKAQSEAAKVDSRAKRVALDKQQIRDQIKFLQDFAKDVDQRNMNPNAEDSHRQEAARLQTLLDK